MINGFKEGIDKITGIPFSDTYFVCNKIGNDSTADGSPQLPYKTIKRALANSPNGHTGIIATGRYEEHDLSSPVVNGSIKLKADGMVILSGNSSQKLVENARLLDFEGIHFLGYERIRLSAYLPSLRSVNCRYENTYLYETTNGNASIGFNITGNVFLNTPVLLSNKSHSPKVVTLNQFHNSPLSIENTSTNNPSGTRYSLLNNYFNSNSNLTILGSEIGAPKISHCCFYGCNIDDMGTPRANNYFPNCFDTDPLFKGDPFQYEHNIVESNSPLLLSGLNHSNIGNVSEGFLLNDTSSEWGISPDLATNNSYIDGSLTITDNQQASRRESQVLSFGRRVNPVIDFNALLDFENNVPDSNTNDFHIIYEAQWAVQDGILNGEWKKFIAGMTPMLDGTGKSTGEDGFDWATAVKIDMWFLKVANDLINL
ncbi:DUF1565 domain-containing protein [Reichenbachiella versicolor]|uniref:DUF1565 domain-containing protein n=1 Tax=Reichenbachiella versicolor TaxID=1821036 RepID=UPI000D6EAABB|nr:DUF1565 domain-containing protein [Reichenbachiella versicolor]